MSRKVIQNYYPGPYSGIFDSDGKWIKSIKITKGVPLTYNKSTKELSKQSKEFKTLMGKINSNGI